MAKFVNIDRATPMLMPPDMRDWLPNNHIVHFIIDAGETNILTMILSANFGEKIRLKKLEHAKAEIKKELLLW